MPDARQLPAEKLHYDKSEVDKDGIDQGVSEKELERNGACVGLANS